MPITQMGAERRSRQDSMFAMCTRSADIKMPDDNEYNGQRGAQSRSRLRLLPKLAGNDSSGN
jgi:hypothetical protein